MTEETATSPINDELINGLIAGGLTQNEAKEMLGLENNLSQSQKEAVKQRLSNEEQERKKDNFDPTRALDLQMKDPEKTADTILANMFLKMYQIADAEQVITFLEPLGVTTERKISAVEKIVTKKIKSMNGRSKLNPKGYINLGNPKGINNVVFDVARGTIRPKQEPYEAIYTRVTTPYNPKATAPKFQELFLNHETNGEAFTKLFKYIAYGIYTRGVMKDVYIIQGSGGDGKTQFLEAITNALGSYANTSMTRADLSPKSKDMNRVGFGQSSGALINIIDETEEGLILDGETLKRFYSGKNSPISLEKKGASKPVAIQINGGLIIATNNLPTTNETATKNRISLVEVETIQEKIELVKLTAIMQDEASGILNLLLDEVTNIANNGYDLPKGDKELFAIRSAEINPEVEKSKDIEYYIKQRYKITEDIKDVVDVTYLNDSIKRYAKENSGQLKITNKDIQKTLKSLGVNKNNDTFKYRKIKEIPLS
ncbi:DUF5906 domain-containing protein [Weissella koreensis]|uniref:Uncharacterized protein n=1 Tax=Weissella koreensis TaxID=165096 RepID=A0A7H1MMS5_9LACO|nr:DUF5906 domain-containing protein [Weissella koreensis]AVH75559.1 hypothetical protein C4597_05890 [Weissella koreensis]EJF34541.1 hypothetical protein JC2156_13810 [Weissella koreensis KCTC 3621]QGN20780.1 hypothetical protein GKC51_05870 [Weissella koreensis]QNT64761.1 hypothetical protein FY536_05600 [Weissella koreensis]